ncbi:MULTISPECIES: EF-hand domain-containing protein [unclassified Streptomyces]|uniref:EF-hand domain-containing protein n=1 Tax=unclassified Streptomyces TaxID=2593676 RepID=UPI000374F6F0|nr:MULTISPECIES: EF-hand domain-containing protein [unclassified Streptomyces]WSX92554.1 EF-hand domain-containing protein [Streptomyces sp. NBC_00891]WSY07031.1 EF-hand domain-containing protein [Streptomyces sp. NBC_00890]WSZ08657.1 EF-hand domain-containing protein [Streptomyces sp. NBC_00869]WSZ23844.1 EF-hand domain-containing protein [Streptomyces sp. NBC_00870]MYS38700.1 EF-hand domain-containing protein [Streptomyces sp. SID4920]
MDSAEYERKIAFRFAAFDQDGNGYIDRADFNAAAARLLTEFGTTARCDKGQALYNGAEAFWQGMAGIADVDGDQRVTREEFVGGAVKRLRDNPERFAEIARPFLRAALAVAAGPTGDGRAPVPAVERALKVLGASPDAAAFAAQSLDTDRDGGVVEEDAVAALAAYVTVIEPD